VANPRVLVVDDYDETRAELVAELISDGFSARGCDEETAAQVFDDFAPAVLILDLPTADVVELCGSIDSSNTKILALVGRGDPQREAARRAGVDFFLLRPCAASEVVRICRRFVRPA
jgi:DNA-binding response OmpR family regulator